MRPGISCVRRAATVKMSILPRVFYLCKLSLPPALILFLLLMGGSIILHIAGQITLAPQGKGFLDFRCYYWACQLMVIVGWNLHSQNRAWVPMLQYFILEQIGILSWLSSMKAALKFPIFKTVHYTHFPEPWLLPRHANRVSGNFRTKAYTRASAFFHEPSFKDQLEVTTPGAPAHLQFWKYLQIWHFLNSPNLIWDSQPLRNAAATHHL